MPLESSLFVLDPPSNKDVLQLAAKRYTYGSSAQNTNGLTLMFAHCIGTHKEQWEPVIERAFLTQQLKDEQHRIREAWAFDWQNHGDSAVLNKNALQDRPEGVSIYEWAPAVAAFARSPRMHGHRLVPLGHSAGAGAMMLSTTAFHIAEIPYTSMILIEPTMVTQALFYEHIEERLATMEFVCGAVSIRRDSWPGREEAFQWLSKRFPWKMWDSRTVRLFVEHGLQDSPLGDVTLKCDKKQEAASYPDVDGHFEATTELARICHVVPVHIIWGGSSDLVPDYVRHSLSDSAQGRTVASVSTIEGAGHMVVQEKPDLLALSICDALDTIRVYQPSTRSRM